MTHLLSGKLSDIRYTLQSIIKECSINTDSCFMISSENGKSCIIVHKFLLKEVIIIYKRTLKSTFSHNTQIMFDTSSLIHLYRTSNCNTDKVKLIYYDLLWQSVYIFIVVFSLFLWSTFQIIFLHRIVDL